MKIQRLPLVLPLVLAGCSGAVAPKTAVPAEPPAQPAPQATPEPRIEPMRAAPQAPSETQAPQAPKEPNALADFQVRTLEGEPASLDKWKGQVVLVVNTASQCGYTPQYAGLEALHQEFQSYGFEVLGFPCNDFGGQEPGDAQEIRSFCTERFQVTFPLFEKVEVKGEGQAPLYAWLEKSTGQVPSWNFCKYLIGRDGKPIQFWTSKTAPDAPELRKAIETAVAAK